MNSGNLETCAYLNVYQDMTLHPGILEFWNPGNLETPAYLNIS